MKQGYIDSIETIKTVNSKNGQIPLWDYGRISSILSITHIVGVKWTFNGQSRQL